MPFSAAGSRPCSRRRPPSRRPRGRAARRGARAGLRRHRRRPRRRRRRRRHVRRRPLPATPRSSWSSATRARSPAPARRWRGRPTRAFADRVAIVAADIAAPEAERAAAGLGRALADAVVMNPPFHDADAGTASPEPARAAAHVLGDGGLDPWLRAAASVLKPGGRSSSSSAPTASTRSSPRVGGRFGGARRSCRSSRAPAQPAHRVLVRARQGQPRAARASAAAHPSRRGGQRLSARRSRRSCATAPASPTSIRPWRRDRAIK